MEGRLKKQACYHVRRTESCSVYAPKSHRTGEWEIESILPARRKNAGAVKWCVWDALLLAKHGFAGKDPDSKELEYRPQGRQKASSVS